MHMTFKAIPFKEWTLTDNSIILGNKEYPLSSISEAKHEPSDSSAGFIFAKFQGKLMKTTLAYDPSQKSDAEKAVQYIFAVIRGEDPQKKLQEFENVQQHGYRKYCNLCGHIFCYTREDLQRNQEYIDNAQRTANLGIVNALAGNVTASSIQHQTIYDQLDKIVDYKKCPKCGSKDIRDATDDEIARNKAPQIPAGQQTSPADELKKYKELLDMGIITQDEFDAKKKQLLGL